jgi:GET complex subunit GET2
MSRHKHRDPFQSIDPTELAKVGGGASRVTARSNSNDQLTTMLTQITQSIQALTQNNNQSDPMQMMMMMMMMGGMGGGGGGAAAAPPPAPAQPPVINISTTVKRHGW